MLSVTAGMSGTELRVTGDGLGNHVDIRHDGPGEFSVTSEEGNEGSFAGVTSIKVDLKGGDNRLRMIGNLTQRLAGNVDIKMGQGDDEVIVGFNTGMIVDGNVNIETSDGDDDVTVGTRSAILGNLTVSTGNQDDSATVGTPLGAFVGVGGNLTIKMGQGNDGALVAVLCEPTDLPAPPGCFVLETTGGVHLGNMKVGQNTLIETSDGNDVVVVGGRSIFTGNFVLNTGLDDDYVQIGDGEQPLSFDGLLNLDTSKGDDVLSVQLSNIKSPPVTVIKTSDGNDSVSIRDSIFASLDVNLGQGDDSLAFDPAFPVKVLGDATLNGSDGTDVVLNENGLVVTGAKSFKSFEFFVFAIFVP